MCGTPAHSRQSGPGPGPVEQRHARAVTPVHTGGFVRSRHEGRDGGQTAAGGYAGFRDVAEDGLRGLLAQLRGWRGDAAHAAKQVLDGFTDLAVHPDVPDGVRRLRAAGFRLATLTNGSAGLSEQLLVRA